MKSKLLNDQPEKTYVVIFNTGDEFMQGLTDFAKEKNFTASRFTAIGAFSELTLGYFDMDSKSYKKIPLKEQVEVLSLMGDIALNNGQPKVHAHVVVGDAGGQAFGGHIMEAYVRPTLEVVLIESPAYLQRETDGETGLALIRL